MLRFVQAGRSNLFYKAFGVLDSAPATGLGMRIRGIYSVSFTLSGLMTPADHAPAMKLS